LVLQAVSEVINIIANKQENVIVIFFLLGIKKAFEFGNVGAGAFSWYLYNVKGSVNKVFNATKESKRLFTFFSSGLKI
jgi:hypothetical protein